MNKYEFKIEFGFAGGTMDVPADSADEATEEIIEIVGQRLADAFPELDIEYSVHLEEVWKGGDPDEAYDMELERSMCAYD